MDLWIYTTTICGLFALCAISFFFALSQLRGLRDQIVIQI